MRAAGTAAIALLAIVASCNSITGTGKYTIEDDAGSDGGSSGASSGSSGASSGSSGDANVQCQTGGAAFPQCSQSTLETNNRTQPGDARIIKVPGGDQEAPYEPNCMMVKVGQTVTWQGNLDKHPLIPRDESSTLPNPIPSSSAGMTSITATFPCTGFYNFSCSIHHDAMLGTIWVVP
jgi:plastocyanin